MPLLRTKRIEGRAFPDFGSLLKCITNFDELIKVQFLLSFQSKFQMAPHDRDNCQGHWLLGIPQLQQLLKTLNQELQWPASSSFSLVVFSIPSLDHFANVDKAFFAWLPIPFVASGEMTICCAHSSVISCIHAIPLDNESFSCQSVSSSRGPGMDSHSQGNSLGRMELCCKLRPSKNLMDQLSACMVSTISTQLHYVIFH